MLSIGRTSVLAVLFAVGCATSSSDDTGDTSTGSGNPCLETPEGSDCASGETSETGTATLVFTLADESIAVVTGTTPDTEEAPTLSLSASGTAYSISTTQPDDDFSAVECEVYVTGGYIQADVDDWITFDYTDASSGTLIPVTLRVIPGTTTFTVEGVWGFYECDIAVDTDTGVDTDSGTDPY